MEVKIIARERIKPSFPTPRHLRMHELSLIDQMIPPVYSPIVLFFDNPLTSRFKLLSSFKASLSETLTRFYPLAGKVKDLYTIECNDDGACFTEATISSTLSDFLGQREARNMNMLLPRNLTGKISGPGSDLLLLQMTTFLCGGFAIGIFIGHVIADGASTGCFLRDWAAASRKDVDRKVFPSLSAAKMFPPAVNFPSDATLMFFWDRFFKKARASSCRFVFDSASISLLKAEAKGDLENPTRVEVVSAVLCKSIMSVFRQNGRSEKPTIVTQAVNMRRRAIPQIPSATIGNFPWLAIKKLANCNKKEQSLSFLASQLREAVGAIDANFVRSLQGVNGARSLREKVKEMRSIGQESAVGVNYIGFTSLCNMGGYEAAEFSFGKPIWCTYCVDEPRADGPLINTVFLMDTRSGDGIEALVVLKEEEIAALEMDKELLSYASLDPSILVSDRSCLPLML